MRGLLRSLAPGGTFLPGSSWPLSGGGCPCPPPLDSNPSRTAGLLWDIPRTRDGPRPVRPRPSVRPQWPARPTRPSHSLPREPGAEGTEWALREGRDIHPPLAAPPTARLSGGHRGGRAGPRNIPAAAGATVGSQPTGARSGRDLPRAEGVAQGHLVGQGGTRASLGRRGLAVRDGGRAGRVGGAALQGGAPPRGLRQAGGCLVRSYGLAITAPLTRFCRRARSGLPQEGPPCLGLQRRCLGRVVSPPGVKGDGGPPGIMHAAKTGPG